MNEKERAAAHKRRRDKRFKGLSASAEGVAGEVNPTKLAVMRASSRAGEADLPLTLEAQLYRYTRLAPVEARGHLGKTHGEWVGWKRTCRVR